MANSQGDTRGTTPPSPPPRPLDPLAAVLSYLIPGLGQIYQGRVGKGLLFLGCIYGLFFYGTYLGSGTVTITFDGGRKETYRLTGSVYLPEAPPVINDPYHRPKIIIDLWNRPQFMAQFWTGVVAWPAIWHYVHSKPATGNHDPVSRDEKPAGSHWLFGDFGRSPSIEDLNAVTNAGDKHIDLSWVFTVIAGVLNIMVIYDALAGPAFPAAARSTPVPTPAEAAA